MVLSSTKYLLSLLVVLIVSFVNISRLYSLYGWYLYSVAELSEQQPVVVRQEEKVTQPSSSRGVVPVPNNNHHLEKAIQAGNHTNIPNPKSRIGPNGEKGYIHDPLFLHKNPIPFQIPKDEKDKICLPIGEGRELPESIPNIQKIRNHIEKQQSSRDDVKLFCTVYTYAGNAYKTNAISQTWGPKCDGMLFASSVSNTTTGHMHLPSNSRNGFEYQGMIQRTRAILAYLYDNFLDEYDFFHISGDDVFILVENLKEFLSSDKVRQWDEVPNQYVIAGFWMNWGNMPDGQFYLAGGSGYTLSKKALKAFVEGPLQNCTKVYDEGSSEDVVFTTCAREGLNERFIDTRDTVGAHRYHQMPIQRHSTFPDKKWGFSMAMIKRSLENMYRNYSFPIVYKDKYISNSSIAFHALHTYEIRRYQMLFYRDGRKDCGNAFIKNSTTTTARTNTAEG